MDKIFYNEGSAAKLGWEPEWFGCDKHGEKLITAIEKFQKDFIKIQNFLKIHSHVLGLS